MDSENYLKYWRVVRYYIKKKYNLTTAELEVLLFLKTEGRFSRDDFDTFTAGKSVAKMGMGGLMDVTVNQAPRLLQATRILFAPSLASK